MPVCFDLYVCRIGTYTSHTHTHKQLDTWHLYIDLDPCSLDPIYNDDVDDDDIEFKMIEPFWYQKKNDQFKYTHTICLFVSGSKKWFMQQIFFCFVFYLLSRHSKEKCPCSMFTFNCCCCFFSHNNNNNNIILEQYRWPDGCAPV